MPLNSVPTVKDVKSNGINGRARENKKSLRTKRRKEFSACSCYFFSQKVQSWRVGRVASLALTPPPSRLCLEADPHQHEAACVIPPSVPRTARSRVPYLLPPPSPVRPVTKKKSTKIDKIHRLRRNAFTLAIPQLQLSSLFSCCPHLHFN